MAYDEANVRWNGLWVLMFAAFAVILGVAAFYLPFWQWLNAAIVLFGVPEFIGVLRHQDSLPPLTYIIRRYLPRWFWFPVMYAAFGGIFSYWLGFPHPTAWAGMFGLLGWLSDHFTVTYD